MSSELFSLTHSKLNLSVDCKDSFSLHRWVLLKNSIIQTTPVPSSSSAAAAAAVDEDDADDDEDSFMFPDAGQLVEGPSAKGNASEAAWFDALLETLEDDDDDFVTDSDVHVSVEPVDDDDDFHPSPPISPMSSSDDLTLQYYPHLVPYPPFSPLISPYHLTPPLASSHTLYADPLPYLYDLDIPPVPDAIEDTSDDESEAPPTPGQSLSSLSLDPASIPLPTENSRLRYANPHVYIDSDDDNEYFTLSIPFPSQMITARLSSLQSAARLLLYFGTISWWNFILELCLVLNNLRRKPRRGQCCVWR
ncbi:hypothetical protein FB45DRAFT_1026630 [Roridomyces roridus]|uniref:Uncharacterized protein n=1 Tax=Roridomyces roridus TaxID=1738132 RepID=A0AAD7BXJ2_9AGAR|nr:hypothetical protein FB45DRAFT_1026630 [Roridomyces roridus]